MPRDEFEKEIDARTLAEAGAINDDPRRLRGAQKAAGRLLADKRAEATALEKITQGIRPASTPVPTTTTVQGNKVTGMVPFTRTVRDRGRR